MLGNHLCVIPYSVFYYIWCDTCHMIHQESKVTFSIHVCSFLFRVSDKGGFMPCETATYGELCPTKVMCISQSLCHLSSSISVFSRRYCKIGCLCVSTAWQSRRWKLCLCSNKWRVYIILLRHRNCFLKQLFSHSKIKSKHTPGNKVLKIISYHCRFGVASVMNVKSSLSLKFTINNRSTHSYKHDSKCSTFLQLLLLWLLAEVI